MQEVVEQLIELPNITVQLVTVDWQALELTPAYPGYQLSQRLSESHAPLRVGNISAADVLPRVHSVGFLTPNHPLRLFPIEKKLRAIVCTFEEAFFESATGRTREQWERHTASLISIRNKRLEIMMQEIHAEMTQPGYAQERIIQAACDFILVELSRILRRLERKDPGKLAATALAAWQLRRIQERLDRSLEDGFPVSSELAQLCGVSREHLSRSFKAATGWQLQQYIKYERMNLARKLLVTQDASCEEISRRLGFRSAAYFSTVFRDETGKTPSEFRRQHRNSPGGDLYPES